MLKNTMKLVAVLFVAFSLTSCGGTDAPKVAEDVAKEMTKEVKKEVKEEVIKASINTEKSKVRWKGEMLGMYSHEGTINLTKGSVIVKNGMLESGDFTVDLASMTPTDDGYNAAEGKTPAKLVGHLSSADFFDVANYPTASFKITSVSGNTATGKLTVRGKTNEEKVTDIAVKQDGDVMKMSGKLTFDRKKYGVAFDHPAKEMVLNDKISLDIKLVAGL